MPLIKLLAMDLGVKTFLIDSTDKIRREVKVMAGTDYGLPSDDIIVNAFGLEILSVDPDAAHLYVEIQTNPGEVVETVADEFRDKVLNIIASVYRGNGGDEIEIDGWVQFIPGSWMLMTSAGMVKFKVAHKRQG